MTKRIVLLTGEGRSEREQRWRLTMATGVKTPSSEVIMIQNSLVHVDYYDYL